METWSELHELGEHRVRRGVKIAKGAHPEDKDIFDLVMQGYGHEVTVYASEFSELMPPGESVAPKQLIAAELWNDVIEYHNIPKHLRLNAEYRGGLWDGLFYALAAAVIKYGKTSKENA